MKSLIDNHDDRQNDFGDRGFVTTETAGLSSLGTFENQTGIFYMVSGIALTE